MKVLIDMTFITPNNLSKSIPIYVVRFLSSIKENDKHNFILLFDSKYAEFFHKKFPDFSYRTIYICHYKFVRTIYKYILPYLFQKKINKINPDIFFNANDIDTYTSHSTKCKKVIVVHDLKLLKNRNDKKNNYYKSIYQRKMVDADVIVTISNFTRHDILNLFTDINPKKIIVIHNSIELSAYDKQPSVFNYKGSYILYVNTLLEYKNIKTLVKAFNRIKDYIDTKLVIVGRHTPYWENEIIPYIKKHTLEDKIIHLQNLNDSELKYMYIHANLFITTSLHEGFGYTPIEAAICKCPVISTKCEALPEVTQSLLNYYEPATDDKKLSEKIIEVLNNPTDVKKLNIISQTYNNYYSQERLYKDYVTVFTQLTKEDSLFLN